MTCNSIIPNRALHDAHHAHACIVCDEEFTPNHRPAGELRFMGRWGDACPDCHAYFSDEEEDAETT